MSTDTILVHLQQAALKDLQPFTGEDPHRITHFINTIEHIGSLTEMSDTTLHALATIKLHGSAFDWYNNNKSELTTWSSLRKHLLDRYKFSTSAAKTQLKTRRQQPGESLLAYYDSIIDLCKQVDEQMPLYMIIDYLQDGVRDDLKIHIKRSMKTVRTEITPAVFLKIAREEEELQNETTTDASSFFQPLSFPSHTTAATHATNIVPKYQHRTQTYEHPAYQTRIHPSHSQSFHQSPPQQSAQPGTPFRPCLICTRTDHRMIDCPWKYSTGCFKCGDKNHVLRHCPQVFH